MNDFRKYPILHVGSLPAPRSQLTITGTTEGLITLLTAVADAIGNDGHGMVEPFCSDAEPYQLHILRQDCQASWQEIPLPYQDQSQEPGEPQDPEPIDNEPHSWNWDDPSGAWR